MSFRQKTRLEKILNGMAVKARPGLEKAVQAAMDRMTPLETNVVLSKDNDGKTVVTLDKTAGELFSAAAAGKAIRATATAPVGENQTAEVTMIIPIEIFRFESEDGIAYTVKARSDTEAKDTLFYGDGFSEDDTVVLTEV